MTRRFLLILLVFITCQLSAQKNNYVILVSFDGFRWDYPNRGITPNLEKVRESGVSALSLRPSFPSKTFPNHLSIITGMYPAHHGIYSNNVNDPITKRKYRMSDTAEVRNSRWYQGEAFWETAERQGITTASFFWPGSEINLSYRHPSYFKNYEHMFPYEKRIDGIIEWLSLPYEKRPHFITLYFHETDDFGHNFGPDAAETNKAIQRLDQMTGLLFSELEKIGMKDSVNVIFVSDHGMTGISDEMLINIESFIDGFGCKFEDDGPLIHVYPPNNKLDEVYRLLKQNEKNYKVYKKEEIPSHYQFNDHPFIGPIVAIADIGWSLRTNYDPKWLRSSMGNHGYDNNHTDMHGIFMAVGPSFKQNYKSGTLWNVDIYPLLCKIFNIYPRPNIDGKTDRIEFLLK